MKRRRLLAHSPLFFLGMLFCLLTLPVCAIASTGFINTPLWISPASPKEGDKVTISAVFHNQEQDTISGSILFYDGNILLAEKPVMLRSDEVGTITASFTITAGSHLFSASTKNLSQVSTTGTLDVITVPVTTVKLPLQFVPKTIVSTAAAGAGDGSTESVVLEQVDKAQTAILSALPPETKKTITEATSAVDNWRSDRAESFSAFRDEAKTALDANKPAVKAGTNTKAATAAKKPAAEAGPLTYIKYVLFSALAFLFRSAVIFYLAGLLVVYLIFRFIWSRIRRKKKPGRAPSRPLKTALPKEH